MSYASARDALIKVLRTIDGFTEQNVTHEDFSKLNNGIGKAIILLYNGFDQEPTTFDGRMDITWHIELHCFAETVPNVPAAQDVQDATRDAILAKLRRYPNLGNEPDVAADTTEVDAVFDAFVTTGRQNPTPHEVGGGMFMREVLTVDVKEDVTAEFIDHA